VVGGSVAQWFALQGADRLRELLSKTPALAGRKITVLNFASGGYKQPQQLIVLEYLLALGQQLDLVINIDGFNELALSRLNATRGLSVAMPSAQHIIPLSEMITGASAESGEQLTALARLIHCRNWRDRLAVDTGEHFATGYFLRSIAELYYARCYQKQQEALEGFARDPASLVRLQESTDPEFLDAAISLWMQGSERLRSVSDSIGAAYLHVLQPNQYFTKKVFSAEEQALAIDQGSPYKAAIEEGYGALRAAGTKLRGVHFVDASGLFDTEQRLVFSDSCCHYNQLGNDLLAALVAEEVKTLLSRK
jgi:hypothetical protein